MTTLSLGDLCDFAATQVNPSDHASLPYLGLEHVVPGRFEVSTWGSAGQVSSSKYLFRNGDVLYGKLRPYLDKAVLVDREGLCTTELLVLRPKHQVDPRFLAAVVHSKQFIDHAMAGVAGAQHPRTSWHHLRDFSLPVFDPSTQAKIGALTTIVQAALVACEATLDSASALKRAAMRDLFTRGLRGEEQKETEIGLLPEHWGIAECGELAREITVGVVVKPASYYVASGVPAFRSLNVKEDYIDTSSLVYFSNQDNDTVLSKSKLRTGDVLIVRTGYPGTSCVVPHAFDGANCIDLVIVRPNDDRVAAGFLSRFLNSEQGRSQALSNSYGLAQQHLNVGAVRRLKIPAPPTLDEQYDIVAILDAIDQKIDLHKRKKAVLEELFKALLHKLMTGEIRVSDLDLKALEDRND